MQMIDEAERKGVLRPGGTIVEATSGNTGVGLALVAAVRGYKMVFTITDKQSREKIDLLKAFGAEVIVCPTAVEPEDARSYYSVAKKLAREIPNAYYANQYENPANPEAHYRTTGPEIWKDTDGKITHFVCGLGTGGTAIRGWDVFEGTESEGESDRRRSATDRFFTNTGRRGTSGRRGRMWWKESAKTFCRRRWISRCSTTCVQVNDEECFVWARRLAKREGIFAGGSGGGCVSAALRVARECEQGRFDRGISAGRRQPLFEQDL